MYRFYASFNELCRFLHSDSEEKISFFCYFSPYFWWKYGFFSTPRILKTILKTSRYLKIFYSKMLRIIGLLCEINRIEEVRLHFSIVNTLITTVKQVFLKVHNHIRMFVSHKKWKVRNVWFSSQSVIIK